MSQHGFFFLDTMTGDNSSTDVSLLRKNVKIKCKEYFFISFTTLACRSDTIPRGTQVFPIAQSPEAHQSNNKANLRDLIAATGLVILLKLDSNRWFFARDLEIWWLTTKNNKAHLLYNINLWVSFHIQQWIETGVTVRKRQIWVKFDDF